jgi:hypothetical protein
MNTLKQLVVVAIILLNSSSVVTAFPWDIILHNSSSVVTAFPWDTPQQNDDFLTFLLVQPPVGIAILSHYDSLLSIVPDARGSVYSASVPGNPLPVSIAGNPAPVVTTTGASFNAENDVTSLYVGISSIWIWQTLPSPTYTRCWISRNSVNINWLVACFTNSPFTYVVDQIDMTAPTTAPLPTLMSIENYVHSVFTWDIALTNAQMKLVTRALRKELGGVPYEESVAVVPITDIRAYKLRFLLALRPPQSINIFADFDGTTVPNRMGNGFQATLTAGEAGLVSTTGPSNGANNSITVMRGTTTTKLKWPISSIPATMTICSVSRFTGGVSKDILTSQGSPDQTSGPFIHGHRYGSRGIALYQTNFMTGLGPFFDRQTNWLIMCGTNGGTSPNNIFIDQFAAGAGTVSGNTAVQLNINYLASDASDFEVHSVYIWDEVLNHAQMMEVTSALRAQIGGTPDISRTSVGPAVVPMTPSATAYEEVCAAGSNLETATGDCVCDPGRTRADGASTGDCVCDPGRTSVDGACVACATDTYKSVAGNGDCAACPSGTRSVASAGIDCVCVAGFTKDEVMQCGGTCGCSGSLAEYGVISDGEGDYSRFDNCWWIISGARPSVTFTSFQTVTFYDQVIVAESDDATFLNGFVEFAWLDGIPEGNLMPALAEMTYTATKLHMRVTFIATADTTSGGFTANWASGGSVPSCSECDAGTFNSVGGTAACETCPANSESSSGSTLCLCSAQFTGNDGGPCSACGVGTDKASVGSASCIACDAGTFKDVIGSTACQTCLTGATSLPGSDEVSDCKCTAGFTGDGGEIQCTPCLAGTYKAATGSVACLTCPANSWSTSASTLCVCNVGYTGTGLVDCDACEAGEYKATTGTGACSDCGTNTWSDSGAVTCTSCFLNMWSASGSATCMCSDGFFSNSMGAVPATPLRRILNQDGASCGPSSKNS